MLQCTIDSAYGLPFPLIALQIGVKLINESFVNGGQIIVRDMVFDTYKVEQVFLRYVIADKCTGTEIFLLHDFVVIKQCADGRELIILCLKHEFEVLNVERVVFLSDFGNGIFDRDFQIFDIPVGFFVIGGLTK